MKKLLGALIALAMLVTCFSALAEETEAEEINTLVEENSFVVQVIDVTDEGWYAEVCEGSEDKISLYDADILEGTFVARFDATADGEAEVNVRHYYNGFACDRAITYYLTITDGIPEETGADDTMIGDPEEQSGVLVGEWEETEAPFASMTIEENEELGWDVEIISPDSADPFVFKTTIYADALDGFKYDKGKYWSVEITDSDEEQELGEATTAGATGKFDIGGGDDEIIVEWTDDANPDITRAFVMAEEGALTAVAGGSEGTEETAAAVKASYYTFEGSGVAMQIPENFASISDEPVEGVFYDSANADVRLQVIPTEDTYTDYESLKAFYDAAEYVDSAEITEINGVEMVRAHGEEDATVCAVISAEGTTYQFVFIPQHEDAQDAIEAIVESICPSDAIPGEGKLIMPMAEDIDPENLADGTYPAAFEVACLTGGALKCDIYTVDNYDIVDINTLEEGDTIVAGGEPIEITKLDRDEDIIINGGLEEDGIVLRAYEEDNCWRVAGFDDYPTWTYQGEAELKLAENAVLTDGWDIEKDPVTVEGADAIEEYLGSVEYADFDVTNTTIRVENGEVVEIIRVFTP